MHFKPVTTEKAVRLIDIDNTLVFEVPRNEDKVAIKAAIQRDFSIKVTTVRTHIRQNIKYAYVRLDKSNKAADLATKLGII